MKSYSTIRRHLRDLRRGIDQSTDPVFLRIAYAMECAVRWAREDTVDWPSLRVEAEIEAKLLKDELCTTDAVKRNN